MCMSIPLERQDVSLLARKREKSGKSHLETLLDLLYEHVTICSETVHGQDCAIGPTETRRVRIDIGEEVGGDRGRTA